MDLNPRRRTRRVVGEHRGGADDYFIPQSDTMVFDGRANTDVHMIPGTGHCAMSKAAEVVPMVIGWLRRRFYGS